MSNTFTIREDVSTTTTNYPVQIGRPFVEGEIADYPQVLITGTPVTTQADIKQRWPDGSVKHAILSFYIPTLSAGSTITCSCQNQASGNNTGYADKTAMLDSGFDFNATIAITNGTTQTASARTMLNEDHYEYWLQGSICTSIIIADHTVNRVYDMGWDAHLSFRPIFYATFWPLINKVRIRYVGEISHTEKLQDLTYSLALTKGDSSPSTVYTKSSFTQGLGTRWTKEYWIGTTPTTVSINHNVAYLAETKFIYNFDTTKVIPGSVLTSKYALWTGAAKDITDQGNLQKAMGTAGGRDDIGPYPAWTVWWLFTGDYRMKEMCCGNADLAGAFPKHFREGKVGKNIQGATSGMGKVMSIRNRPTLALVDILYDYTTVSDRVLVVGPMVDTGWVADIQHVLEINSVCYMLTGDHWYLEQMYFFGAYPIAYTNGAAYTADYGRGPTGAEGGLFPTYVRGEAWTFRNICHAAFNAPDSSIEKTYFTTLIDDAISSMEGHQGIYGSAYTGNAMHVWAITHYLDPFGLPPLHQWIRGSTEYVNPANGQAGYGLDWAVTLEGSSQFEQHFMMLALGRGKELGYATDLCLERLSYFYINALTHPDYNPYLIGSGRVGSTKQSDSQYFTTWAELKSGYYATGWQDKTSFTLDDPQHGYEFLGLAASAQMAGAGSEEAWVFARDNILVASVLNDDPRWAIIPRTTAAVEAIVNRREAKLNINRSKLRIRGIKFRHR